MNEVFALVTDTDTDHAMCEMLDMYDPFQRGPKGAQRRHKENQGILHSLLVCDHLGVSAVFPAHYGMV